eukprot:8229441-Pyramimonas_sp.AAC.1
MARFSPGASATETDETRASTLASASSAIQPEPMLASDVVPACFTRGSVAVQPKCGRARLMQTKCKSELWRPFGAWFSHGSGAIQARFRLGDVINAG